VVELVTGLWPSGYQLFLSLEAGTGKGSGEGWIGSVVYLPELKKEEGRALHHSTSMRSFLLREIVNRRTLQTRGSDPERTLVSEPVNFHEALF